MKDYKTPRGALQGLEKFFQLYDRQRPDQARGYHTPTTVYFPSYSEAIRKFELANMRDLLDHWRTPYW